MNEEFALLGAGVLLYGAFGMFSAYARRERSRLASLKHWAGIFAEHVESLSRDLQVPRSAIEALLVINGVIGQKYASRALYLVLSERSETRKSQIMLDLEGCEHEVRGRLQQSIAVAFHAGFLAVTYSDWWWGIRARAAMAERMTEIAEAPSEPKQIYPKLVADLKSTVATSATPSWLHILTPHGRPTKAAA